MSFIKKEKLNANCPECDAEFFFTIDDALSGKTIKCPSCGVDIELKPDAKAKKELSALDRSIDEFSKKFK